jgi:hypothetical protein
MKAGTAPMKNFHVPLREEIYSRLRAEAERARHNAIAAYADEMAGTEFDLDPELELAGTDHLTDKSILSHELLSEAEDGLKASLDLE